MESIQAVVLERLKAMAGVHFSSLELSQIPVIVAYSGGLDSSVLLHACHQLYQQKNISRLAAAHVNHGLQALNDSWEQHCINRCEQYQITLHRKQFALSEKGAVSENEARKARYQFFEQLLSRPSILLFAHHLDDQVETMLFRMIRGTGVHGLVGIPQQRRLADGWIARPLLEYPRSKLALYANKYQLSWVDDPSNQQNYFSRNYLRNHVVPQIESKWPEFSRSFKQLSEVATEQKQLLDEIAEQDIRKIQQDDQSLNAHQFNQLSKVRRKNLLHYWVRMLTQCSPTAVEINQAIIQLENLNLNIASHQKSSVIKVKLGQGWLRSYNKKVYYCLHNEPNKLNTTYTWQNLNELLKLDNGITLSFVESSETLVDPLLFIRKPAPHENVTVKARLGGELAKPAYRAHSTGLKKIFQELKVPTWKRDWLPIVYFDDKIACIPGVLVDQAFRSDKNHYHIKIQVDSK